MPSIFLSLLLLLSACGMVAVHGQSTSLVDNQGGTAHGVPIQYVGASGALLDSAGTIYSVIEEAISVTAANLNTDPTPVPVWSPAPAPNGGTAVLGVAVGSYPAVTITNDEQGCHNYCDGTYGSTGDGNDPAAEIYDDLVGFSFFEDTSNTDNNRCFCYRKGTQPETHGAVNGESFRGWAYCFGCLTEVPSSQPSSQPSGAPSSQPSSQPSGQPSSNPSEAPSGQPSSQPSGQPSSNPSEAPSSQPSSIPSRLPSSIPSEAPSSQPSSIPSEAPSSIPSEAPSGQPSSIPSEAPSSIPSESPTSQPSEHPSEQPSCTPSMSPTDPETTFMFYPDWSGPNEGCLNDGNHPNYMAANPGDYLYSTLDKCCTTHYGWNYDVCMGLLGGICARSLWYPDWEGADEGCVDDGNEPAYMTDNAMYYLYNQRSDCCQEHYSYIYEDCVGAKRGASFGLYYPDWDTTDNVCKNDGNQPKYMSNSPQYWMHDSLTECCNTNFQWAYDDCIGSAPSSTPADNPSSGMYYPDWLGGGMCVNDGLQPAYMSKAPELWMYDTIKDCCKERYNWAYSQCVGQTSSATGKYFYSSSAGKCIIDGQGGSAGQWETLFDTLKQCCSTKNWWNNDCDK